MREIEIPDKLQFLFSGRYRYKVARGGRGSAKSWSFARALLVQATERPLRILCAREVQTSIKQSVHRLLKDQIQKLDLGGYFKVLDNEIRGNNGSLFTFIGLNDMTVDNIKSYEGYDICWVEEGQVISRRSWKILIPTIRKPGSQIWISYNPDLDTDETHKRFTIRPPKSCMNVEINWRDNPFFNDVLEAERLHCLVTEPDDYDNIWEGKCRAAVSGAIYFKQVGEAENNHRICNVPHDPMLKTHVVFDLGWDDSLAVSLVQCQLSEIRIIEYIEVNHTTLSELSAYLRLRPYSWGRVWLPYADGFSETLNAAGKSTYDILTALGWDVAAKVEVSRLSISEGIRATRMAFGRIYFDKDLTAAIDAPVGDDNDLVKHTELSNRLLECLRRYRRHINRQTEAAGVPVRDAYAHGADNLRYIATNADNMTNEVYDTAHHAESDVPLDSYAGDQSQNWMV